MAKRIKNPLLEKYNKDVLKDKLSSDTNWMLRALSVIYDDQTDAEKHDVVTKENNGRGFGKVDVKFFSSLAEQYQQRKSLSPKQIYALSKRLPKYWKQIQRKILARQEVV